MRKTPKIIYHYCSTEAFIGILSNKYIRLSPFYDLNDSSEGRMILNAASNYLESTNFDNLTYVDYRTPWELVKEFYRTLMPTAFYTASFCSERDLVSQWRAYAKEASGFAIGFSVEKLSLPTEKFPEPLTGNQLALKEVRYCDEDKIFKKIIEEELKRLLPFNDKNINEEHLKDAALNLLKETYISKNSFFKEEKEWRIIYTPAHSENDDLQVEFECKNNNIKQYFKLDFEPDCIVEVVQGPKNKTNINILKNYLYINKISLSEDKIIKSKGSDIFRHQ